MLIFRFFLTRVAGNFKHNYIVNREYKLKNDAALLRNCQAPSSRVIRQEIDIQEIYKSFNIRRNLLKARTKNNEKKKREVVNEL